MKKNTQEGVVPEIIRTFVFYEKNTQRGVVPEIVKSFVFYEKTLRGVVPEIIKSLFFYVLYILLLTLTIPPPLS